MNQALQMPVAPPYFIYGCDLDSIVPTFSTHELSSPLKLKFDPEELIMQFNKEGLEKTIRFDPKTGEKTDGPYNPAGSKYFIQTEAGTVFTDPELT